ncbi:MAG: 50S ribosomal protein L18 [Candidatus Paceibacterales bacterium]
MSYLQRKNRVKAKIAEGSTRPRLSVFRSNKYLYAQIIDDGKNATIVAAKGDKTDGTKIGEELAKKAIAKKVKKVVFDRNGFAYHGTIKALAEGARKGGLVF